MEPDNKNLSEGWVGFRIGSRGEFNDYKDSAVRGDGLDVGLGTDGLLYIGGVAVSAKKIKAPFNDLTMKMSARPDKNNYTVILQVYNKNNDLLNEVIKDNIHPGRLTGNIALVCSAVKTPEIDWTKERLRKQSNPNRSRSGQRRCGNIRFWFSDWTISGSKVISFENRAWGPILFAQYTLSKNVMKLTAQMAPVGNGSRTVRLQIRKQDEPGWKTIGEAVIDPLARTAAFRISDWDDTYKIPYRLVYSLSSPKDKIKECQIPNWEFHLQQMVLEKEPLKYLERFLK